MRALLALFLAAPVQAAEPTPPAKATVVSVYDGDRVLVFQGASPSSLGWLAEKNLP